MSLGSFKITASSIESLGGPPPVLPVQGPYQLAVLCAKPIAYWKLDETVGTVALDEIGSNNGTYNGAFTLAQPSLLLEDGKSVDFVTNAFLDVPEVVDFSQDWSVELWIQIDVAAVFIDTIFEQGLVNQFILVYDENDGSGGTNRLRISYNGVNVVTTPNGSVTKAVPLHIVVTYKALTTTTSIYVSGKLEGINSTLSSPNPTGTMKFGLRVSNGGDIPFQGEMDEISIYDYELTPHQVVDHFTAGTIYKNVVLENGANVTGYWKLDETSGILAIDETGNNNGLHLNAPLLGENKLIGEGTSYGFDGVVDSVSLALTPYAFASSAWSLEYWFEIDQYVSSFNDIASVASDSPHVFIVVAHDGATVGFRDILFGGQSGGTWGQFDIALPVGVGGTVGGKMLESDNTSHHLVITYDGILGTSASSFRCYFDGREFPVTLSSGLVPLPNQNFFAPNLGVGNQQHNGRLDEIAYYNKVLTPEEVDIHFQAGIRITPEYKTKVFLNSVVAHYPMDDFDTGVNAIVHDVSSNCLHGIEQGTLTFREPSARFSREGKGIDFTGATTDYVLLPTNPLLEPTEAITVECFIRLDKQDTVLVTNSDANGSDFSGWKILHGLGSNTFRWYIGTVGGNNTDTSSNAFIATAANYPTGETYHVVGTYSNGPNGRRLYINGHLAISDAKIGSIKYSAVTTGLLSAIGVEKFNGSITPGTAHLGGVSEVTIYNEELNATSIFNHFLCKGTTPSKYIDVIKQSGPMGYWRLHDADILNGTQALDDSGFGRHGTYVTNGTNWNSGPFGVGDVSAKFVGAQKVTVPDTAFDIIGAPNQAYTFECWVRFATIAGQQSIMTKTNVATPRWNSLLTTNGTTLDWQLWDGAINPFVDSPTPMITDKWNHVVAMRTTISDGGSDQLRLYLNGILSVSVGTSASTDFSTTENLEFAGGGIGIFGVIPLLGDMAHVAVYDRSLPSSEVLAHYDAGRNCPEQLP